MTRAWTRLSWTFPIAACAFFVSGCAPQIKTAIGPDNSHVIVCGHGMSSCVTKAAKICGEDGSTILSGVSRPKLLGGESSSYKTMSELAELTVRCGLPGEEEEQPEVVYKLPERTDEPIEVPEPRETAPSRECTPGSTLACVGPGACQGGQVCLESGQGYGPCDCGVSEAKPPTEEVTEGDADGPKAPAAPKKSPADKEPVQPVVPGAAPAPTPLSK